MIKPLRQRHFQVWIVLMLLLPTGILLAWLAIPNAVPVKLLQNSEAVLLPEVIAATNKKDYTIQIRSNKSGSQWQLEWKNKTVLMVPSAVINRLADTTTGITQAQLIGRIEAKGTYVFPLTHIEDPKKLKLVLYDFIHEKEIETIHF